MLAQRARQPRTSAANGSDADLSLQRALAAQFILIDRGIAPRRMEAIGCGGPPADVSEQQQAWLSQCILFELVSPSRDEQPEG